MVDRTAGATTSHQSPTKRFCDQSCINRLKQRCTTQRYSPLLNIGTFEGKWSVVPHASELRAQAKAGASSGSKNISFWQWRKQRRYNPLTSDWHCKRGNRRAHRAVVFSAASTEGHPVVCVCVCEGVCLRECVSGECMCTCVGCFADHYQVSMHRPNL